MVVGVHRPMTERATISVLKNCLHLKYEILMMIAKTRMLLRHVLFHEIKRKSGHQLPAQVILAALLLATFFAKKQALHVMQNFNANQNLIHSNYSSEMHCWTRFEIGQMPKGCLYTKKIGLL